VQRDQGLVFEYDAYARSIGDQQTLSLGSGLRWFGRYGSLEGTGVSRGGDGGSDAYDRLDTRWSYSDPDRLWTWPPAT
jgi:outer membrane usher protein